ncbi:MAG: hypothetical protein E6K80_08870 [Candidatus Eisenbacteria bacterium]|uniref:Uncharacterized protein n=1 Tax=Eiseniibacteriota bacterium TaxID=2212470 RepID=A0A538U386_UNCEI|nr:MAG: hypothetical protein E6K80_08870 [Candidatus Eisenbacteria bacterium]
MAPRIMHSTLGAAIPPLALYASLNVINPIEGFGALAGTVTVIETVVCWSAASETVPVVALNWGVKVDPEVPDGTAVQRKLAATPLERITNENVRGCPG